MKEIFHFTAEWCNPCKAMKPIIEELLPDYPNASYTLVDVDENFNTAHVLSVRSVPTLIVMENNAELKRHVGAATKEQLIEFFDYASN